MAEVGRIKPQTKMACPSCRNLLPDFSVDDVAEDRPIHCPQCRQQVKLPDELVGRASTEGYLGRNLDIMG